MTSSPRTDRTDRVARGVIIGGGVFVFALFAWGHLGLGAWLVPPAATAAQQTAKAGPYAATLLLDGGQLTAGTDNRATLVLRDASGQPLDGATVNVQPVMTTMQMNVPPARVAAAGGGKYVVHPAFSMAGPWRMDVTIARPGQPTQHVSFAVGVRWK
jgi:hypothetical protein